MMVPLLLALLSFNLVDALSLSHSGTTVDLDGIPYFISPYSAGRVSNPPLDLPGSVSTNGLYPMTILPGFTSDDFSAIVKNFTDRDDVFQIGFLQIIYSLEAVVLGNDTKASYGINTVAALDESTEIPQGPYFLDKSTGDVFPVYKLYSDFAGSFTQSLLLSPDGNFMPLSASIPGADSLTVGVPSRWYSSPSAEKPLAGIRVGIKDIYDVAHTKRGCGNRAYYNLYPANSTNSLVVQRLVDAGAVIVGKQKTSQFANGERPTADWVDYHAPFNPRADGYQSPSSSSSGAGSSIGSYPWLDIAVGSDTGGSIRGPSSVQGLYGNRPSHNAVELTGVMPLSPLLDTAGFLTRDPQIWGMAQEALYGGLPQYTSYPSKIITYGFPTDASPSPGDALILDFLANLQSFLSANVSSVNLTTEWAESTPAGASADLTEFLNITYTILVSKQQTQLVRDPFYADYAAVHDGRLPFVDPVPLVRWAWGDGYPDSALDEAVRNKTIFQDWFNSNYLVPDLVTCSNAFMVYAGSPGMPDPRNEYVMPPSVPVGFGSSRISVFAEVPDSVFPIGQVSYFSNITQHVEFLPVSIDIMAAKGCDSIIYKLAQDLVEAGILNVTQPGQTIYGGDILHKRSAD